MLNSWTYAWFGQPASNQTQAVQKSQDQSHLQPVQAGRSSQQLNQQHTRPTTRVGLLEGSEWKGNGEDENSQVSADSFRTALDVDRTTRANGHHHLRFEEASSNRPLQASRNEMPGNPPHTPFRPPLRAPTISSNTLNRLKAQLSSRSLPPKSPPLQSIPDQPKNMNRAEFHDVWPSPQPQHLPRPPLNTVDRSISKSGSYGEAGMNTGDEARERHRDGRKEWQDNRKSVLLSSASNVTVQFLTSASTHRSPPYSSYRHQNRKDPYLSDPSSHFPHQLDYSQFDPTRSQLVPTQPHLNLIDSQDRLGLHHPFEFDGQSQFFDHQDSPSFPFPANEPAFPSHDRYSPPVRRPSSMPSEATLHEASRFSPNRPVSTPHQLTSTIPFPHQSRHTLNPHGTNDRGSDRHLEEHRRTAGDWERSVEEEVRKRIELEKRLGGFGRHKESPEGPARLTSRGQEEPERIEGSSENPSRSSRSTGSIGFFPELPPQPEIFLFEVSDTSHPLSHLIGLLDCSAHQQGLLLVPPLNFTSLTEIAKLHRSHWIPYHAILTTRSLHFLVNSDPSTQTPILILDFERCKSLNKPRELRDREQLFSFVAEIENGKKRYFACESARDWTTWSNKIRRVPRIIRCLRRSIC